MSKKFSEKTAGWDRGYNAGYAAALEHESTVTESLPERFCTVLDWKYPNHLITLSAPLNATSVQVRPCGDNTVEVSWINYSKPNLEGESKS